MPTAFDLNGIEIESNISATKYLVSIVVIAEERPWVQRFAYDISRGFCTGRPSAVRSIACLSQGSVHSNPLRYSFDRRISNHSLLLLDSRAESSS
jgi:hypothetical protein